MTELDVTNNFLVGVYGTGEISIALPPPPGARIPRDKALRLAAWLVAVADPEGTEFPKILDAVNRT